MRLLMRPENSLAKFGHQLWDRVVTDIWEKDVWSRKHSFLSDPEGPEIEKRYYSRSNEKNISPRSKFSFSLENFNPGPCFFLRPETGSDWINHSRLKISFRIESLTFFNIGSRDWFVQSLGPLGAGPERTAVAASECECDFWRAPKIR